MGMRRLDSVIDDLGTIVDSARREQSEIGIFPAMYRLVTMAIGRAIAAEHFDDPVTMERLAVVFADRYLDAYRAWSTGSQPTESWLVTFEAAADRRRRTAAQHLLAGMNAHINLDLGVAAWEVCDGDPAALRADFYRVNDILFDRLDANQAALASVSRRVAFLDRIGGRLDERAMSMAISEARDRAWDLTLALGDDPARVAHLVDERDRATADIGRTILGDSLGVRAMSFLVARSEGVEVADVIEGFTPAAEP